MKEKNKKFVGRIFAMLLTLVLLLSAVPLTGLTAFAGTGEQSGDFLYTVLEDGTAAISGYCGESSVVNIPQMLDGYTVTEIAPFSFNFSDITELHMPDSIETVGNLAIQNCQSLEKITFSKNLRTIALQGIICCDKLTSVTLPQTIEVIASSALGYTMGPSEKPNVETIFPIEGFTIYGYAGTVAQTYAEQNGFTFVDISASGAEEAPFIFKCSKAEAENATGIVGYIGNLPEKLVIPSSIEGYIVSEIGNTAFAECTTLKEVWIPNSVTSLGTISFYGCENLDLAVIGSGVTVLPEDAFKNCTALRKIVLSDALTDIPMRAFWDAPINAIIYGYKGTAAEDFKNAEMSAASFYVLPDVSDDGLELYYSLQETTVEEVIFALYLHLDVMSVAIQDVDGNAVTDTEQTVLPGMSFCVTTGDGTEKTFEIPNVTPGDVNGDNKVDAVDARWVLQAAAGMRTLENATAADVNRDGKIDAVDARWILQAAAGMRTLGA